MASKKLSDQIWDVADLLRGDFKRSEYGRVILPFTILRRFDAVLARTRGAVLAAQSSVSGKPDMFREHTLRSAAGEAFYNTSAFTFSAPAADAGTLAELTGDPSQIGDNLRAMVNGFSANAREVFDHFRFFDHVQRLEKANLLFQVTEAFQGFRLHPTVVDNHDMGTVFEELIRKFAEQSNETAGEHFTPREVIKLMVAMLFSEDRQALREPGVVRSIYDPACGTGGMLSVAETYLQSLNPEIRAYLHGQELNPESYAICKADMLIKGHDDGRIRLGNSFTDDHFKGQTYDYVLSNPPFGVNWKKVATPIRDEHDEAKDRDDGRFGAGLPRISDGSFLFLQHMLDKRKRTAEGTRLAVVFNGSPLFSGGAGSGESEIRRWLFENDWVEAIVALPTQLFYNTGIATYVWIVTNRKRPARRGLVQLIDASDRWVPMPKSLGDKRRRVADPDEGDAFDDIRAITDAYLAFDADDGHDPADPPDGRPGRGVRVKILPSDHFGFRRVRVHRPSRPEWRLTDGPGLDALAETHPDLAARARPHTAPGAPAFRDRAAFATHLADTLGGKPFDAATLRRLLAAFEAYHPDAPIARKASGDPVWDKALRDFENVPLGTDPFDFLRDHVLPHDDGAAIDDAYTDPQDGGVGRVGYEIPLGREFYVFEPPPDLDALAGEIEALETEIQGKLAKVIR